MNILKANQVDFEELRRYRRLFSDISEHDIEEDKTNDPATLTGNALNIS